MIAPQTMRLFAAECLRWSDQTDSDSHRELLIQIAKTWMATASTLDRRAENSDDADLRRKLA